MYKILLLERAAGEEAKKIYGIDHDHQRNDLAGGISRSEINIRSCWRRRRKEHEILTGRFLGIIR